MSRCGTVLRLDRLVGFALLLYLLVLPIPGTTALRNLAFLALVGFTAFELMRRRQRPELPFAGVWLAYFAVAALSLLHAVDVSESLAELRVEVVYGIVIVIVGTTWGRRLADFGWIVWLLVAVNLVLTLSAFRYASLDMAYAAIQQIPAHAYAGLDGNWLLAAIFLMGWQFWRETSTPRRLLLAGLILLDLWAMLTIQNRQNFVALAAGLACVAAVSLALRFHWRRAALFAGMLLLAGALLAVQMNRRYLPPPVAPDSAQAALSASTRVGGDVRWALWRFSLDKIAENPWQGGGVGRSTFAALYPEYRPTPEIWHAHNMVLNKGIQMGVPGMLVFLALWAALARELLRHLRRPGAAGRLATVGLAVVVAAFVKNMTDDFFVRNVALFFWLLMGLLIGHLRATAAAGQGQASHSALRD